MESKLLKYLMRNYDREVRPVVDPKTAMVVNVGITLTQIFDMVSFVFRDVSGKSPRPDRDRGRPRHATYVPA